jgi:hypothetical protein
MAFQPQKCASRVHSANFRVFWQEGTESIETGNARSDAMDLTKRSLSSHVGWKQVWATLPLAGAIVLSGCGSQLAAPSPLTETPTNAFSGPNQSATKAMSLQIAQNFSDAKYVKIFDNLAKRPSGIYWGESEYVIVGGGGNSQFPDNQIAGAFTPSANQTATVIEAAIVNPVVGDYGSTGFSLSVNQDNKGIPGKALITAQLPGLPNNGLGWCCAMVIGKIPSGLPLSGDKQYWLVLSGQSAQSSDGAGWDMNAVDQLHPFLEAVYCAYASKCPSGVPGWYPFQMGLFGTGAAFAVLGSK